MRQRLVPVAIAVALCGGCAGPRVAVAPAAGVSDERRFVDSVLAAMTLEEKLGQLNQLTASDYAASPESLAALIGRGGVGSRIDEVGADTSRALQRIAVVR